MPSRIPRRSVTRLDWSEIDRCIQNLHAGLDANLDRPGFFGAPPVQSRPAVANVLAIAQALATLGLISSTIVARPTVAGSRGGNVALQSLLQALASLGLVVDTTVV